MNDKIENSSFDEVLLKPYIANFYKYNFKMYDNQKLFLNKNFINQSMYTYDINFVRKKLHL